jgi:hypothetical protein
MSASIGVIDSFALKKVALPNLDISGNENRLKYRRKPFYLPLSKKARANAAIALPLSAQSRGYSSSPLPLVGDCLHIIDKIGVAGISSVTPALRRWPQRTTAESPKGSPPF